MGRGGEGRGRVRTVEDECSLKPQITAGSGSRWESELSSSVRPEHRPGAGGPGSYTHDPYEPPNTSSLTACRMKSFLKAAMLSVDGGLR